MKILKQVDASLWTQKVVCKDCDSELEVEAIDVKYEFIEGSGRDLSYDSYDAECIVCHNNISLSKQDIPKTVRILVKNRSKTPRLISAFGTVK